jgi:uncharacterized protein (DUF1778 family)
MHEDIPIILPNDSLRMIEAAAISGETVEQFILRSS